MNIRVRILAIGALVVAAGFAGPLCSTADAADGGSIMSNLVLTVRQATDKYHDVAVAEADGYASTVNCVSGEDGGAMGIHYARGDLLGDGSVDAEHPEMLIYEPKPSGALQLVAVEYVTFASEWDAAHPGVAPALMGQLFDYHGSPNRYALPALYALHVWAWKKNPKGSFAEWNPNVTCVFYSQS